MHRSASTGAPQISPHGATTTTPAVDSDTPGGRSGNTAVQRSVEVDREAAAPQGGDEAGAAPEAGGDLAELARKIAPLIQRDIRQRLLTERERAGGLTSRF